MRCPQCHVAARLFLNPTWTQGGKTARALYQIGRADCQHCGVRLWRKRPKIRYAGFLIAVVLGNLFNRTFLDGGLVQAALGVIAAIGFGFYGDHLLTRYQLPPGEPRHQLPMAKANPHRD